MLDSNGSHNFPEIYCALCPRKVRLEIYEPRYGHAGENLTCGPYLWEDHINRKLGLPESLLLKFVRYQSNKEIFFKLEKYQFVFDGDPYAYGCYPLAPSFGLGENKVIWICDSCTKLFNQDIEAIHFYLSNKITEHYNVVMEEKKNRKKLVRQNKLATQAH